MWSTAAFEGAQIRIFVFYELEMFLKYEYYADNKPINVVVLPVPGGPCKSTTPDLRRHISRIDSYCVVLYSFLSFSKSGSSIFLYFSGIRDK